MSDWNNHFYSNNHIRDYLSDLSKNYWLVASFIKKEANLSSNSTVFDQCCGEGMLARELSLLELNVLGVDICFTSLRQAKKINNEKVKLVLGDASEFYQANSCDAAVSWYSSFHHSVDDKKNYKMLENLYLTLRNNGTAFIETMNKDFILNNFIPEMLLNNNSIKRQSKIIGDIMHQTWTTNDEKIETNMKMYSREQILNMLSDVGFKYVSCYSDIYKSEEEKGRVVFVAKK